jgi:hypothetical protein
LARIRSIKPEFCSSVTIARLSVPCRLHFAMLWTYADDEGRGIDHPLLIKAAIWPLDPSVTAKQVEQWQDELSRNGRILRYQWEGKNLFQVTNWLEHQRPNRPKASVLPAPSLTDHGPDTDHGRVTDASRIPHSETPQVRANTDAAVTDHGRVTLGGGVGEGEGEGEGAGVRVHVPRPTDTFAGAIELLLLRLGKHESAATKANPTQWLVSARRGLKIEHHDTATELLTDNPAITAEQLADALVPTATVTVVPRIAEYIPEGVGNGAVKKNIIKNLDDEIGEP